MPAAGSEPNRSEVPTGAGQFATTHWSVVLAAGRDDSPQATEALEKLCRAYWYPLFIYIRRQNHDFHDAKDLTQAYFERLLEKKYLGQIDREKGKFRSFLLASLKHFLSDQRDHQRAAKRGGGKVLLSLDAETAEDRYRLEPVSEMTAERIFDRRWALTVLDEARDKLREEYGAAGKAELFENIRIFEAGDSGLPTYAKVAVGLGITESAVKAIAHRLRQRFRELVRAEVAQTVARRMDVDEEIRHLLSVIAET